MTTQHTYDRSKGYRNLTNESDLGVRHDKHLTDERGAKLDKVITTKDNAFVRGSQTVDSVFREYPYIVNVLIDQGLVYTSQLPRDVEKLIKIKGIGKKSAERILEVLK